jgi:hypothetical protein
MELWDELKTCRSKKATTSLAEKICQDSKRYSSELMISYLGNLDEKAIIAAWVVRHCFDLCPDVILPHTREIVRRLSKPAPKAVKRTGTYILQYADPDEETASLIADVCFKFLNNKEESVAVRSFSMGALYHLALLYPELKEELRLSIELQLPYGSPGFKSRGRKILNILNIT